MPAGSDPIDEDAIAILARAANLPLQEGRAGVIAKPLSAWLSDANELSRKMSEATYLGIVPVTTFNHRSK